MNWSNYIINCEYNGAEAILQMFYGNGSLTNEERRSEVNLANKGTRMAVNLENLQEFNQDEFFQNDAGVASMDSIGYVYTPSRCQREDSEACHLHVHFHGCGMGRYFLGDSFIVNSSLLEAAEANNIVMVFPQVVPQQPNNGNGCWNWWGYLHDDKDLEFATKAGAQMAGVARMIETMAGVSMLSF